MTLLVGPLTLSSMAAQSSISAVSATSPANLSTMTIGEAIRSRKAIKYFASTPIPDDVLMDILQLTQRAPSCFNSQPYKCVLVRDQEQKEKLAAAMMAGNVAKIKDAPVSVVFAADLEPGLQVPRIQELMRGYGVPESVITNLPNAVRSFSQHELPADSPHPLDAPTIAWSFKQTALAVATLLYAATEHGVATGPMEGFNEAAVREALEIPDRYKVAVVVSLGYPKEGSKHHDTDRLPPSEVFFEGKFGESSQLFQK